jgi:hypothetical protein
VSLAGSEPARGVQGGLQDGAAREREAGTDPGSNHCNNDAPSNNSPACASRSLREQHMRLPIYAIAILTSASVSAGAKEQSFSKRSARVWVGCEDTRGTQIEYHAPPGWRIIRYDTGWAGLYGVEGHSANVQANSRERPTSVLATGTITGRTKGAGVQILGHRFARCPGGGRGWLQVAGIIAR